MKRIFLLLYTILVQIAAWPQRGNVSGSIVDKMGGPVVGAIVTQYVLPDTTKTGSAVTSEDGTFQISSKKMEENCQFLLKVKCWGYRERLIRLEEDTVEIVLEEDAEEMKEVVVEGTKRSFTQELGKFVFTPGTLEQNLPSSYDMLKFTPMVNVVDDAVSIVGKGVATLYINGRKQAVTNDIILNFLRSMPAKKVEKIEVITAPGVTQSASMQGGIVNVVLKRMDQGLMGNAVARLSYKNERLSTQLSNVYNYSRKKLNGYAYWAYANQNSLEKNQTFYSYTDTGTDWNSQFRLQGKTNALTGALSLTYDLTKKSILGWSGSFYFTGTETRTTWENIYSGEQISPYQTLSSERQESPFRHPRLGTKLYYNLKTDERGSNLDLSISYATSNDSTGRNVNGEDGMFQQNTKRRSHGVNATAKYTSYFKDKSWMDLGYEYGYANLSNTLTHWIAEDDKWVPDDVLSNRFDYTEQVNSGFLSYSRTWSKAISSRIGARIEQTRISGYQHTTGEHISNRYTDFVPQASLVASMAGGKHSLSFDYTRRLRRPFYTALNPFRIWTSENSYSTGNPNLTAAHTNSFDLTYNMKGNCVVGLNYDLQGNCIERFTQLVYENTTEETYANIGRCHILGMYANINKSLLKGRWYISGKAEAYYIKYDANAQYSFLTDSHWTAQLTIGNIFRLSVKRQIQLTLSYMFHAPSQGPTYIRDRCRNHVYLGLSKRFKKGGMLSIDVNDLVYTRMHEKYDCAEYCYWKQEKGLPLQVVARYSHTFGNTRVKGARDNSSNQHINRLDEKN